MEWQLAEAKNKFSEVVTRALHEGPQRVRRRDGVVIVLSETEYQQLTCQQPSFIEHLMNIPDLTGVDLERDQSPMRDVDL
jgi:prevent-host-death family protein